MTTKNKLEKALEVFRTPKNSKIIDNMIEECLETMHFIIESFSIEDLRTSFFQQNFSCWNNILELNRNNIYY